MAHLTPSRLAAAAAMRELNHAFVAHDADDATLDRIAEFATGAAAEMRAGERRDRATLLAAQIHHIFGRGNEGGGDSVARALATAGDAMADRAIAGAANPTATIFDVEHEGHEVVVTVTLGAAYEGAPGRAHGGMVAAVFDDVTGAVLHLEAVPAYTGRLCVTYHRPVPVERPLVFRARATGREGRKLHMTAECHAGDELVASCDAVYVTVEHDQFGRRA
jgi:acyl-coenzyme A thioesterase PaaI-like protein